MTASIRRAPEPTEPSERITKAPISAVERTCVPPQSSRETPSISTTRTMSPYFSPNSIIAPSFRASSIGVSKTCSGWFSKIARLTRCSTSSRSSAVSWCGVREVEPELVGPDGRACLLDMVAEHVAERLLQEMRRGVVRHRREAHAPRDDRAGRGCPRRSRCRGRRAPGRRRSGGRARDPHGRPGRRRARCSPGRSPGHRRPRRTAIHAASRGTCRRRDPRRAWSSVRTSTL